jgi:hypothetical protein
VKEPRRAGSSALLELEELDDVLPSIASIARIPRELARLLSAEVSSFDYFWLAVATDVPLGTTEEQRLLAGLPVETGLLEVRGAHIRLVRAAQRREGAQSSEILAELLAGGPHAMPRQLSLDLRRA